MSLAAGERKKEMVQIECRWVECSRRWRLQQKTSDGRLGRRYGWTSSCCVNDDRLEHDYKNTLTSYSEECAVYYQRQHR